MKHFQLVTQLNFFEKLSKNEWIKLFLVFTWHQKCFVDISFTLRYIVIVFSHHFGYIDLFMNCFGNIVIFWHCCVNLRSSQSSLSKLLVVFFMDTLQYKPHHSRFYMQSWLYYFYVLFYLEAIFFVLHWYASWSCFALFRDINHPVFFFPIFPNLFLNCYFDTHSRIRLLVTHQSFHVSVYVVRLFP